MTDARRTADEKELNPKHRPKYDSTADFLAAINGMTVKDGFAAALERLTAKGSFLAKASGRKPQGDPSERFKANWKRRLRPKPPTL